MNFPLLNKTIARVVTFTISKCWRSCSECLSYCCAHNEHLFVVSFFLARILHLLLQIGLLQVQNKFQTPNWTHKLNYINCVVLIYPTFSLLQDTFMNKIIGHGTRKGNSYYMGDFSTGQAHNMINLISTKERQIWLWHHRLGHHSFVYIKHLFSKTFSNLYTNDFNCVTCILAKSHTEPK